MSDEYGEEAPTPTLSAENGWREDGGTRGERKEAEWQMSWRQLRRVPSLSCIGIDGQIGHVSRAGPRHDPFNSACANLSWSSCRAWAVASAHSAGPAQHDYIFYFTKIHIYICTIYEHDVLLVRRLHPLSLPLLPPGHRFIPHLQHRFLNILHWFNQMALRVNGPARLDQQVDVLCLGRNCGSLASGCHLAIYMRRCGFGRGGWLRGGDGHATG
jgi:hypothetical protein